MSDKLKANIAMILKEILLFLAVVYFARIIGLGLSGWYLKPYFHIRVFVVSIMLGICIHFYRNRMLITIKERKDLVPFTKRSAEEIAMIMTLFILTTLGK